MADISFNIACKELKIAQIAQLNQLFQLLHWVLISRPRLVRVKSYANEEKCKRWRQQRFAYWRAVRIKRVEFSEMQRLSFPKDKEQLAQKKKVLTVYSALL